MRLPELIIACLLLRCATTAAAGDGFSISKRPGPHAVGVRIVQQYDRARAYKGATTWTPCRPKTLSRPARATSSA